MCLNLQNTPNSQYYTSCVYTLRAASIQYQIKPKIDSVKDEFEETIRRRTSNTFKAALGVAYGYFQKGSVLINTDFKPVSDSLTVETGTANTNLTLTWTF